MPKHITDDADISDEENSKTILIKKILMKKFIVKNKYLY